MFAPSKATPWGFSRVAKVPKVNPSLALNFVTVLATVLVTHILVQKFRAASLAWAGSKWWVIPLIDSYLEQA
jgi:hypothetical protein